MTQWMEDLPLVPSFGKPNALEPGRKSRRTSTIAKQQPRFKGDAIAKHDVFGQVGEKYEEMHMKKPNEKMVSEKRPKRESAFTPGSFSGTDGEYCIHRWVYPK